MIFCVSVFLSMGYFKFMDKKFYNKDEWFLICSFLKLVRKGLSSYID